MTIGKRLIILLAVPLLALLGLGLFTRFQLARIERHSHFLAETQIPSVAVVGNASRSFAEMRVNVRSHLLAADDAGRGVARAAFVEDEAALTRLLQQYGDGLITGDRDRRLFNDYRDLCEEWIREARQLMELAEAGRPAEAVGRLGGGFAELGRRLSGVSAEWIRHNEELAHAAGRDALAAIEESRWRMLFGNPAALLLTALLGFLTYRRIVRPICALNTSVQAIAAGDYAKEVPCTGAADETGGLARSVAVLKEGAAAMGGPRWAEAQVSQLGGELQGATSPGD
ncbi:MAG TPA: MCP four helix bundle domain-containing protein, partial [Verrucomicrobiota bacterium]|nr:MCP four helix bundle domain-containing protein [Verrucomicrobiota bacterium]